jgi:serine/threonine protein phosphatase PrpC
MALRRDQELRTGEPSNPHDFEQFANVITNAVGERDDIRVNQYGTVELDSTDVVMLCSDGIVGDRGSDLLTDDEIRGPLHWATSPEQAAQGLIDVARKRDDKTALVVGRY